MTVENFSLDYKKLIEDFLDHLFNSNEIWFEGVKMGDSVYSLRSIMKSSDDESWRFSISPPWIISITDDDYFVNNNAYLVLGGRIIVKEKRFEEYNFYSSIIRGAWALEESREKYISCCEKGDFKDWCRVVRRFHFDTGEGIPEKLETRSHLQFGGICHEESAIVDYEKKHLHYCLDNKIKIPRLPYPPIGIIELLDILLRQFKTPFDKTFIEEREWIELVRRSEDFRLFRYYSEISNYYKK